MLIVKGVHAGKRVTPAQYCNDWIMSKELPDVFSPLKVQIESADEMRWFWTDKSPGCFWELYEPMPDGTFAEKGRVRR